MGKVVQSRTSGLGQAEKGMPVKVSAPKGSAMCCSWAPPVDLAEQLQNTDLLVTDCRNLDDDMIPQTNSLSADPDSCRGVIAFRSVHKCPPAAPKQERRSK